jgi:histidyl-tRNA synthetase
MERGIEAEAIERLQPILNLEGTTAEKLDKLEAVFESSETGKLGISEMRTIFDYVEKLGINLDIELDLALARGLNYYTGAIFEVKAKDFQIGSISGGGRYDNLTGIFGLPGVSGVGISFGADRIYDVMTGLELFPDAASLTTKVLFTNFGGDEELASLKLMAELRAAGVSAEIYPENRKMGKQMEYANRRSIPYVVIVGGNELAEGRATVKNMIEGSQESVEFARLAEYLA